MGLCEPLDELERLVGDLAPAAPVLSSASGGFRVFAGSAPNTRRVRSPVSLPVARRATRVSLPLVGAFVIGAIAYGGLYTFPAISLAFGNEFEISRTLAVTPWTMFLLVSALASPLLGRAYDEFADRDLLTASMILLAGGWLSVYLAPDISLVILAYGVFHALGLQLAFLGISTAIARRYAGLSGLALGIAYAGPGLGVAIALPTAASVIESVGWRPTALLFLAACLVGVAFVFVMTSGPAIVVPARRPNRADRPLEAKPAASGTPARGEPISAGQRTRRAAEADLAAHASGLHETAAPGAISAAQEIPPTGSGERPHSVKRIVRTRRFWILFAGAVAIGVFDEGVLQAFVPSAVAAGLGSSAAAAALGLQSAAYVGGQVAGGWLSDRWGRRPVGLVAAVLVGAAVIAAIGLVTRSPELAVWGIIVHGAATGATIAVRSAAFGDIFGGPRFGTIFGLLAVAYPVGGAIAVYLGAVIFDRLGTYAALVPITLFAVAVWAVSLWVGGPRRRQSAWPARAKVRGAA
jgi:MFS family permease